MKQDLLSSDNIQYQSQQSAHNQDVIILREQSEFFAKYCNFMQIIIIARTEQ